MGTYEYVINVRGYDAAHTAQHPTHPQGQGAVVGREKFGGVDEEQSEGGTHPHLASQGEDHLDANVYCGRRIRNEMGRKRKKKENAL